MRRILAILPALALLGGCIAERSGVRKAASPWRIGVTTRCEVVAAWGNPDAVSDGVWIWRDRKASGGKVKVSFWSIGATVVNVASSVCEHRLAFDANGLLVSHESVDHVPGGAGWSINPWY